MFTSRNSNLTKPLTVSIIYTNGKEWIEKLCRRFGDTCQASVFVPNIGETFIDHKRNEEYEVKDVIRSLRGDEYVIQVQLKVREHKKYQH